MGKVGEVGGGGQGKLLSPKELNKFVEEQVAQQEKKIKNLNDQLAAHPENTDIIQYRIGQANRVIQALKDIPRQASKKTVELAIKNVTVATRAVAAPEVQDLPIARKEDK
jgi:uncharacterized coiled-coil protein SlyX